MLRISRPALRGSPAPPAVQCTPLPEHTRPSLANVRAFRSAAPAVTAHWPHAAARGRTTRLHQPFRSS